MPQFLELTELATHAGTHLGYSEWHEITQRQVDLFAEATWDPQWIHVDPVRAATGPYGGTIAHGFLTISLAPALLAEIFQVRGIDTLVNQGLAALKLRAAVPVGAQLRMGAELISVRDRPRGFVEAVLGLTFEIDNGTERRRAATAEWIFLLHRAEVPAPG